MNKTLEQLKIEKGEVYFRKYEDYSCKLLDGSVSSTNYCIVVKTEEDSAYVFFHGSTYGKQNITVLGSLVDSSHENILKIISEPLDYNDGVIESNHEIISTVENLIDDNATWIEEEVETLMSEHGINISLFLASDQIDSQAITELEKALNRAKESLNPKEPLLIDDESYYDPDTTLVTSDGCVFDIEPPSEAYDPLSKYIEDTSNQDEFDYLESMEENRYC